MQKKVVAVLQILATLVFVLCFALPGRLPASDMTAQRNEAGLTEKSVTIDGHKIVYLEGGTGDPILMVHGFGANKDHWTAFSNFITPAYHVVALDLPGFGESTYLENASYSIEAQAKRIDQFATAVGLKKFHVVGSSMGGLIAGRYAVMFPERVMTLGLFCAAGVKSPVPSEFATKLSKGEPNPLIVKSPGDLDRLLEFAFFKPPQIPDSAKKLLLEEALSHAASNATILKEISAQFESLEPDLPKIQARTFVLWGDHDRFLHVSCVPVLEKGLKSCTSVIMKDCGHLPMMERPQEAAEHYLAFLKSK